MAQHQTYEERRQQIIRGALQAFSEKGYLGTSNKDIAQAAGINSAALIYHYFESKEALFQAVIAENLPPVHLAEQMAFLKSMAVRDALTFIGTAIVNAMAQPQATILMRLMLAEALREPEVARAVYKGGPAHVLAFLYDYFGYLIQEQHFKEADLGATVRCFVGPLLAFVMSSSLLDFADEQTPDATVMVETAVTIFLAGMEQSSDG